MKASDNEKSNWEMQFVQGEKMNRATTDPETLVKLPASYCMQGTLKAR